MGDLEHSGLKKKAGQLFMTGISGTRLSESEKSFIREEGIGFVILFSRNFSDLNQFRRLTAEIHQSASPPPAIFIDQEGGPIIRLGEQGSTVVSPMALAATGNSKNAEKAGRIIGREMRQLGVDGVFAPVLDVNSEKSNPVIGIRSFSDRPEVVSEYSYRFYQGVLKGKILACGKHYPGHGHTTTDSHLELPVSHIDHNFFSDINLPPFQKLINTGIPALMTAHVRFPALSKKIATFSPELTGRLLRDDLGFCGVLFSDCIEMEAVSSHFTPETIISGFGESSLDVISVSHSRELLKTLLQKIRGEMEAGRISPVRVEQSLKRIAALKRKIKKKHLFERLRRPGLRKSRRLEMKLAEQSITLLKNEAGLIPLDPKSRILVVDPKPGIHTANANDKSIKKGDRYFLSSNGDRYFSECRILIPKKESGFGSKERKMILDYDHVLVFDHSWRSTPKRNYIMEVSGLNKDMILICANSPYVAEQFRDVSTIVLTYGSRTVQMEALFRILSGEKRAPGKLPVTISEHFPAGSG